MCHDWICNPTLARLIEHRRIAAERHADQPKPARVLEQQPEGDRNIDARRRPEAQDVLGAADHA
jgi:hypothetical protein